MRSGAASFVNSVRYLLSIRQNIPQSGLPRRPQLILMATQRRGVTFPNAGNYLLFLIDGNPKKKGYAERTFGESCTQVNPLGVRIDLRFRVLLLLATILPRQLMVVFVSLVFALNLRRQLPTGSRLALYNPQHLLLWAVSEVLDVEMIFHLAPEYPRIRRVQCAYACTAAHEILGYPPENQRITIQPHTVIDSRPVIRIYLSQLAVLESHPEDAALIEFVRWVRERLDVSIEIFLHYTDRGAAECDPRIVETFSELVANIRRDDSLHTLSSCQVSLSGSSSIGYDLLSSNVCHVMAVDRNRWEVGAAGKRLASWRVSRFDVVDYESQYHLWLQALWRSDRTCFEAVFKGSAADVCRLLDLQTGNLLDVDQMVRGAGNLPLPELGQI